MPSDHYDRYLDAADLDLDAEDVQLDRATLHQVALTRRAIRYGNTETRSLITQLGETIMASLDNLTAVIATLNQDVTTAAADVTAAIDALKQQIADLSVGAITQDQIDALTASVTDADTAVDALDASVKPAP